MLNFSKIFLKLRYYYSQTDFKRFKFRILQSRLFSVMHFKLPRCHKNSEIALYHTANSPCFMIAEGYKNGAYK